MAQTYRSVEQDKVQKYTHLKYNQLISHKNAKVIQWRNDNLFHHWCCGNYTSIYQKMNLYLNFIQKNFKMDHRFNCKISNYKASRRKYGRKTSVL